MNSSKNKKNCGAFFFKLLGTFLGMNKGSADGNPQPLIEYVQKNHQIMQFDTENHMKKLLTCGILHYMIDVKELAYEILVHFRYLHCRVINERVQDRKNYSEISALLQIERGSNGYSMFFPFFFILIKSERFQNIFFLSMYICFNPIQASCTPGLLLFSDHLWPSLDAFFKKPFLLDKVRNLESAKVEPYCLPYALDGILPLNSSNNQ